MRCIVYIMVAVMMTVAAGCSSPGPAGKVDAAGAVQVVQSAESAYPGVNISEAIGGLLKVMASRGASVKISGWSQAYRPGGTHDIWFKVKTDGEESVFHWEISPAGEIIPINSLARNVSKPITAK